MVCSFLGHGDSPESLYPALINHIEFLIVQNIATRFYVGNHGNFDKMVLKALRHLKKSYPYICYYVVLAYMPGQKQAYALYEPAETVLPEGIERVPKRFAISWRNKWMICQADMIICYIKHTWGGAAQYVGYAKRNGKNVINLATGSFPQDINCK